MEKISKFIIIVWMLGSMACRREPEFSDTPPVISFLHEQHTAITKDTAIVIKGTPVISSQFAAINTIRSVQISNDDSILVDEVKKFPPFNAAYRITNAVKNTSYRQHYKFKCTDLNNLSAQKELSVYYIDTFRLVPAYYTTLTGGGGGKNIYNGFSLSQQQYIDANNTSNASLTDITCKVKLSPSNNYLARMIHTDKNSGTKLSKVVSFDFFAPVITSDYLKTRFFIPADTIKDIVNGDIIICRMSNGKDYYVLRIQSIVDYNLYTNNYYIIAWRKGE